MAMFITRKHKLSSEVFLETTSIDAPKGGGYTGVYTSVAPLLELLELDLTAAMSNAPFTGMLPASKLAQNVYGPLQSHLYINIETLSILMEVSKCSETTKDWIKETVIPRLVDLDGPMINISAADCRQHEPKFAIVLVTDDSVYCQAPEGFYFTRALDTGDFGDDYYEMSGKFGYRALGRFTKMYSIQTMTKFYAAFSKFSVSADHDLLEELTAKMGYLFDRLDTSAMNVDGPKRECDVCMRDVPLTMFVPREKCTHSFCSYCTNRISRRSPRCPVCRQ